MRLVNLSAEATSLSPYLCLIIAILWTGNLSSRHISYQISPVALMGNDQTSPAIRIELKCTGDDDGETEFRIPTQYAGTKFLYRHIYRLRCQGSQSLMIRSDSSVAVVIHQPGAQLALTYEIRSPLSREIIANSDQLFSPLISMYGFHAIGAAIFIVPESDDGYSVTLENTSLSYTIYNSFGINKSYDKSYQLQTWYSPDTRWLSSVFTGGMIWEKTEIIDSSCTLRLIWPGAGPDFKPAEILNLLSNVSTCQNKFLVNKEHNNYTVVLVPLQNTSGKNPVAYTGSALHHSMVAYVDPLQVKSADELLHFFSHEMMHEWIGGKIRCGSGPDDMKTAWFSEGFTEYFALLSQREGGLITAAAFDSIAQHDFSDALAKSPVIHATNNDIAKGFFDNPDLRRLPYLRGFVFAKEMDDLIHKKSGGKRSLKDVVKTCEVNPLTDDKNILQFLNVLASETGKPVNQWFKRFILEGEYPMK